MKKKSRRLCYRRIKIYNNITPPFPPCRLFALHTLSFWIQLGLKWEGVSELKISLSYIFLPSLHILLIFKKTPFSYSEDMAEAEEYFEKMAALDGINSLPSGILFEILERGPGTGKSPRVDDPCSVHYHGMLTDGSVFDSSVERGRPSKFAPSDVIPGWKEVLQYMSEGEKWKVYLPYKQGYGSRGAGRQIPPYSTLIFTIELVEVVQGGKSAAEGKAMLEKATGTPYDNLKYGYMFKTEKIPGMQKLKSGILFQILKVNSGGKAGAEGHALLEADLGKKYADIPVIEEETPTA